MSGLPRNAAPDERAGGDRAGRGEGDRLSQKSTPPELPQGDGHSCGCRSACDGSDVPAFLYWISRWLERNCGGYYRKGRHGASDGYAYGQRSECMPGEYYAERGRRRGGADLHSACNTLPQRRLYLGIPDCGSGYQCYRQWPRPLGKRRVHRLAHGKAV